MPEKEKDSYEMLLERLDAKDAEIKALRDEVKEVIDFNRALLARSPITKEHQDSQSNEKFEKYLRGE